MSKYVFNFNIFKSKTKLEVGWIFIKLNKKVFGRSSALVSLQFQTDVFIERVKFH